MTSIKITYIQNFVKLQYSPVSIITGRVFCYTETRDDVS